MTKHLRNRRVVQIGLVVLLAGVALVAVAQSRKPDESFRPVTDKMLQKPPAADWLSFRGSLNAWGYSPLDQLNSNTVKSLHEVWTAPVVGTELTPLVHDGVMYLPLGGDGFVSLDAATGKERWRFVRELPNGRQPGGTKRNIAIYEELLISASGDGSEFAVDARTGKQVWEVKITGPANTSSGPIIADGKVISGRACAPDSGPVGCVMLANDARTGKEL